MSDDSAIVVDTALRAVRHLPPPEAQAAELSHALLALARDGARSAEQRVDLLRKRLGQFPPSVRNAGRELADLLSFLKTMRWGTQ